MLSEVKGEVETVIKTGRQIVQKQQTEQPKELDDRVTALKLLYNQLGSQVSTRPVGHTHTHTPYESDSVTERWVLLLRVCVGHWEQTGAGENPQAVQEAAQGAERADGVARRHGRRADQALRRGRYAQRPGG